MTGSCLESPEQPAELLAKDQRLRDEIRQLGSVLVAYSGGVDSSYLALVAFQELSEAALAVIAVSPSLAQAELVDARRQAEQMGFPLLEIATNEVENELYRANGGNRCYFCKATLFDSMSLLKQERGFSAIAYGANMDDLSDVRPGHAAARAAGVLAPFVNCHLYKEEIRTLAALHGLPSWDRPQAACLSSRFPDFTPIDASRLALVERAEALVKAAGFKQVRVRFLSRPEGLTASVEVGQNELALLTTSLTEPLSLAIRALGFEFVQFDKAGYRQGNANAVLFEPAVRSGV